jgi:NADH-quinone oxidoreductase subunit I
MAATVKVVTRRPLTFWEKIFVPEIIRGLKITSTIFLRNLWIHTLQLFGLAKDRLAAATFQFPEKPRPIPERYRTRHRLMKLPDGTERCVACMMCETVCPAYCIEIVAEERFDGYTEKRPSSFVVDLGKCIYCGACVEVCPCDAIRMDTRLLDVSADTRQGMIYDKDDLLAWKELPDGAVVDLSRRAELGTRSEVGEQVGL